MDPLTSVLRDRASWVEPVEVVGDGPLASALRDHLAHPGPAAAAGAPRTVIEASGTAEGLVRALGLVADLGVVVLAGPAPRVPVDLDLYTDLHVRGLTLRGLRP